MNILIHPQKKLLPVLVSLNPQSKHKFFLPQAVLENNINFILGYSYFLSILNVFYWSFLPVCSKVTSAFILISNTIFCNQKVKKFSPQIF